MMAPSDDLRVHAPGVAQPFRSLRAAEAYARDGALGNRALP